jgi:hypothetical protein
MQMAFKLLIDLAERSGNYDEEDLVIMRGIATDICNPTYDYFGTLLRFAGSNPSGHPLTTVINSLVNSLYMRYVFYVIMNRRWRSVLLKIPKFADVVSLITYGDDNAMSVKSGYDDFNHTSIASVLEECGIKYTMADKESESVPYIPLERVSFLKRYAVWDESLQLYRSVADGSTISKQLHCHIAGALTPEMAAREAILNVADDYFQSGEDIYTLRRQQLMDVAEDSGIAGMIGILPTYTEKLVEYKVKHEL